MRIEENGTLSLHICDLDVDNAKKVDDPSWGDFSHEARTASIYAHAAGYATQFVRAGREAKILKAGRDRRPR